MFEWDELKAALNFQKHGVSVDEAKSCFSDPGVVMGYDVSHSGNEDRYIAIAKSNQGRILTFIFTVRRSKNGKKEIFRIISARQANKKERKAYPRR